MTNDSAERAEKHPAHNVPPLDRARLVAELQANDDAWRSLQGLMRWARVVEAVTVDGDREASLHAVGAMAAHVGLLEQALAVRDDKGG